MCLVEPQIGREEKTILESCKHTVAFIQRMTGELLNLVSKLDAWSGR